MTLSASIAALLFAMTLATGICHAAPMSRQEFLAAAEGSFVTEMGSFGTTTGDEKEFGEYIRKNWRGILEEFGSLEKLKKDPMHGLSYTTIPLACEDLPPLEYLDFLDGILDVVERRKANNESIENTDLLLVGRNRKNAFLEVNWENPRVQRILQRAIRVFSDVDPVAADSFRSTANGELADSYLGDRNDSDPLPETLPGVKLKRPWASLIKKHEMMTGTQAPHDPHYNPRPPRRDVTSPASPAHVTQNRGGNFPVWLGMVSAVALILITFFLRTLRRRNYHR